MREDKFNNLTIGDYVVLTEAHKRNMSKHFDSLNRLLDGVGAPWPQFEEEAFTVNGRPSKNGLESPYVEPIYRRITPQMVDGCEILAHSIDRRPSVFFKENKEEILKFFQKIDGVSNAHGDVSALISFLDGRGWLNNAIPSLDRWRYLNPHIPLSCVETMGFHIKTPYMEFGLEVCPPHQSYTWTPQNGWHDKYDIPHVEFAFDPRGTWVKWGRCSFIGVLPSRTKRRGMVIQDVFDVLDELHTKKGFKKLYEYSKDWNQTYFE
jgi:hypothetical protein